LAGHNEGYVRYVAVRLGLDRDQESELTDEVERAKEDSGRGGDDNLDKEEIEEIARRLFPYRYR